MANFGAMRFLLLASALTLALPALPARAEDGLPEVEIDGSVLRDIGQMQSDRNLAPVQLKPPVIEDDFTEPSSLTSLEDEIIEDIPPVSEEIPAAEEEKPYKPVFLSESEDPSPEPESVSEVVKKSLSSPPAMPEPVIAQKLTPPVIKTPEPVIAIKAQPEIVPEIKEIPSARPTLASSGSKAGIVSSPVDAPAALVATPPRRIIPEPEAPTIAATKPAELKKINPVATFEAPLMTAQSDGPPVNIAPLAPAEINPPKATILKPVDEPVALMDAPPRRIIPAKPAEPVIAHAESRPAELKKMNPMATFEVPLAVAKTDSAPIDIVPPAAEIQPPKVMKIKDGIEAPSTKPVVFPVTTKTRTERFDPSTPKTAIAPVKLEPIVIEKVSPALEKAAVVAAVTEEETPAPVVLAPAPKKKPVQVEHEIVAEKPVEEKTEKVAVSAPVPKPRPPVQTASAEFVKQARDTLVETYTSSDDDGVRESVPAKRLSVHDIQNDPLASQLIDMTPQQVAAALNDMEPAIGAAMPHEVKRVSKPRIIRIEGERLVRKRKKAEETAAAEAAPEEPEAKIEQASMTTAAAALPVKETAKPVKAKEEASSIHAIAFKAGETDVPANHSADDVIKAMTENPELRVQIVAFASAEDGKEGTARRTSLSRALAVRSWLVSKGIDATRMDVRALGLQGAGDDPDRVEMILVNPKKG